ncbi:hypothetical protein VPH35_084792 [Triticum aestivum]
MFGHKEPKIDYYVCTINKTFAKPGQGMYFQVEYTEGELHKYNHEDDDTLSLKLVDGTMTYDTRFILGTGKRATIATNWSWFRHHANIHEGEICVFHFKRKAVRRLSRTVHHVYTQ